MTAPNPEEIRTQDGYDEWLNDRVDFEISEFVEFHEEPFQPEQIRTWIVESPATQDNDWSWAKLYDDVRNNSYNYIREIEILIPAEDPWRKLALAVQDAVIMDLQNRMSMKLEERGFEVER